VSKSNGTLKAKEVAARLGISVTTLWKRRRAGQAPTPLPMDGHPRWSVEEVDRFLAMDPKAIKGRRRIETIHAR
jgi:predicted DNA-binding transcriptional regulator AlpA